LLRLFFFEKASGRAGAGVGAGAGSLGGCRRFFWLFLHITHAQHPPKKRNQQKRKQMLPESLAFAVVDEADSILIDESRNPMILSSPLYDTAAYVTVVDRVRRAFAVFCCFFGRCCFFLECAEKNHAPIASLCQTKKTQPHTLVKKSSLKIPSKQSPSSTKTTPKRSSAACGSASRPPPRRPPRRRPICGRIG
jgi:hypothetical protein